MKKRKHIRKLISLLLVMALMSTCLGVGSVSADDRYLGGKDGLCVTGWHNTNINDPDHCELWFYQNIDPTSWNTCAPVIEAIHDKFDTNASANDVHYLYLTGHGNTQRIYLSRSEGLLYSDLKAELDDIPGHFIIFLQCCRAGAAIGRELEQSDQYDDSLETVSLEQEILRNFFGTSNERSGALANNTKYTVFCAVQSNESATAYLTYTTYSRATFAWAQGLGWTINSNGVGGYSSQLYADTNTADTNNDGKSDGNNDGIVTAEELNAYAVYKLLVKPEQTPCYSSMYYFRTIATMDYPLGDANKSGGITSQDATKIQNYIAGNTTLDSRQKKLANVNGSYDANGNDTITMADVLCIQKYLAGVPLTQLLLNC